MQDILWTGGLLIIAAILSYHRAVLSIWCITYLVVLPFVSYFAQVHTTTLVFYWTVFFVTLLVFQIYWIRRQVISKNIFKLIQGLMPSISSTERAALEAGSVGWEGELFSGKPNWSKLLKMPVPSLTKEEKAFLAGPVNTLCSMIDNWEITHHRKTIPDEMWDFLKQNKFFGIIIPKEYGGLGFSAFAHSAILVRIAGRSTTVAVIVSVPNSLGPAELLMEYGTEAQKKHYLPNLASGSEIPCFALTGPDSGSDATNMPDNGIVCKGQFEGKETIGIRLNWNKRYITLSPVATVLGLAFHLYDPEHLIGQKEDIGITCALIPTKTTGVVTGRRHYPLNSAFPNGPTQGKDVFIPLDWIIGGVEMVGQGWRMLVERLAVGRAISLPSLATGGALAALAASGAYTIVREQFGLPLAKFGGIQEALARIGGYTYIMDSTRLLTLSAIQQGEEPAVASAISKYHVTELGRKVGNDAMDIHGGKGICLGPKNYLGRAYQELPIGITVEGANILTRSMIIFGQGVVRCHPYVLAEINAVSQKDEKRALVAFDHAIFNHVGFIASNLVRSFWLGLSAARFVEAPKNYGRRYYQHMTRYSAAMAFMTDATLLALGSHLKRNEKISARLADILSSLYLLSSVLKHHVDQGESKDDQPLVDWACHYLLYETQEHLDGLIRNFPISWLRALLRWIVFPRGKRLSRQSDILATRVAHLVTTPSKARSNLISEVYLEDEAKNPIGTLQVVFQKMLNTTHLRTKLARGARKGRITGVTLTQQIESAHQTKFISDAQATMLRELDAIRQQVIAVDDFSPDEI